MLVRGVLDAAVVQVPVELRLVDGVDRAEPHRHRRELPEVGHETWVRVGGQPAARVRELLPEAVQPVLVESSLEEGSRVDAGGRVTLDVDLVAAAGVVRATEEVVEADLVEGCARGVRRDVSAHANAGSLRAVDHDRRVPADVGPDASLHPLVAGEPRLLLRWDGVDVVGGASATGRRQFADVARCSRLSMRYLARYAPWVSITSSSESRHSCVSSGSTSTSWVGRPALIRGSRSRPVFTLVSPHFVRVARWASLVAYARSKVPSLRLRGEAR